MKNRALAVMVACPEYVDSGGISRMGRKKPTKIVCTINHTHSCQKVA